MSVLKNAKRVVIKVGTSSLTYPTGALNFRRIEHLVKVLSDLKNAGKEIILVSSGAIGVGVGELGLPERPKDTPTKQACAAVGQCELMYIYDKLFAEYHHKVAQVLLTRDTIKDEYRKTNVTNTFQRLLELGIVPVVNENDTVAVEEIEFGDNDTLSAIVGSLCRTDLLIVLSDIDGLYDKDPRQYKDAKLIHFVDKITDEIRALAGGKGSAFGTGGMVTKLNAAELANQYGFPMMILNGLKPEGLYDLYDGKEVGTLFDITRK
ncbi:glutamate 5-kinase [Massiliimalia massiliensis]|uniref:glutamate 5-kinase n=1 Tax=Massiliimalia massiliensis TaxID=1852384 RepID=UPI000985F1CD|nr:glutamate 5-kinase [Massiliimalia massiliensis]